jgi:hypothetical protein
MGSSQLQSSRKKKKACRGKPLKEGIKHSGDEVFPVFS